MSLLTWDQSIAVGIEKVDGEHQNLIRLMNSFYEHNARQGSKAQANQIFGALIDYTKIHFANEEAYMMSVVYPGVEMHKKIHKELLAKLENYHREFSEGDSQTLGEPVFQFFKDWLIAHIKGVDRKYANYNKSA